MLKKLYISRDDFTEAFGFTKYMLDENIYELSDETSVWIKKAYLLSIIISYIRPFILNTSTLNSPHKLFNEFVESDFSQQEKDIHYKIVDLGYKIYAHSDAEPGAQQLSENEYIACSAISNSVSHNLTEDRVKLLQNIIIKLLSFVARETSKCMQDYPDGIYRPGN